ncbi:MAG: zinc-dependent metalloprotease [Armatimonadetes bacterium]|nr:zinc-dependent metalloprotease [Armatimonadota bacterium]
MPKFSKLRATALLLVCTGFAFAQTTPEPPKTGDSKSAPTQPAQQPTPKKESKYRPYKDLITADFKTQEGLFKVHRKDDKVYWEIPDNMLGRDMLWSAELSEVSGGTAWPGAHLYDRLIRFERRENRIFIRSMDYSVESQATGAIADGIAINNVAPILGTLGIDSEGEKSVVVDATGLLMGGGIEGASRAALRMNMDPSRSYLDRVTAFPQNIESSVVMTGASMASNPFAAQAGPPETSTFKVHFSLNLLPEKPMMQRYRDDRVGFFANTVAIYGGKSQRATYKDVIHRFRLEKKDPNAAVSEPVKPIVFYLSREVPEKYRAALKRGVEGWNPAFEQAGFKNAIICKDAPTEKEDPNWSPEDARYNVIRWTPLDIENAYGPHVVDPRSGEVINAHVIMFHGMTQLVEDWAFTQIGPLDPKFSKMPFSDEAINQGLEYTVCHEVGHTLGLEHNFKANSYFTVNQLRDPKFVARYGITNSIMDYARFNYVAQPGDGVPLARHIGDYDKFAIEWGYKPITGARTPEEEVSTLDSIAGRQATNPYLRFGNYNNPLDPTEEMERVGSDTVAAARLGLKNLQRVGNMILPATGKFGDNYDLAQDVFSMTALQYILELFHVTREVGGVVTTNLHVGRGGNTNIPVPKAVQQRAVRFLLSPEAEMPKSLLDPKLLYTLGSGGSLAVGNFGPKFVLGRLFSETKLRTLMDAEARGGEAYTVSDLTDDVTNGVWRELMSGSKKPLSIGATRRSLQMTYLDTMDQKLNGPFESKTDLAWTAPVALRRLAHNIDAAIPHSDTHTAEYLSASRKRIESILKGVKNPAPAGGGNLLSLLFGIRPMVDGCWNDQASRDIVKAEFGFITVSKLKLTPEEMKAVYGGF